MKKISILFGYFEQADETGDDDFDHDDDDGDDNDVSL